MTQDSKIVNIGTFGLGAVIRVKDFNYVHIGYGRWLMEGGGISVYGDHVGNGILRGEASVIARGEYTDGTADLVVEVGKRNDG